MRKSTAIGLADFFQFSTTSVGCNYMLTELCYMFLYAELTGW
jgi:hypothetical protein